MRSKKVKKTQKNYYYSFLTVFLLICTIYLGITAFYNVVKLINYNTKLIKLEAELKKTADTQKLLKAEIEGFKSPEAYEAFLRNHLKYAAPDEILVIIVPKE